MTESPRWERESQEDLRPSEQQPQQTTELEIRLPGRVKAGELREPPEYASRGRETAPPSASAESLEETVELGEDDEEQWPGREPRLLAARESLSATRESVGESLSATRESLGESLSATRESLSATATKVGRWLHSLDRRPEFDLGPGRDPVAELTSGVAPAGVTPATGAETAEPPASARDRHDGGDGDDGHEDHHRDDGIRFPTAPLGYNRQAVDHHVAGLEAEIAALLEHIDPPVSISEEIERLGEQTASILVVAHDKAHETARRAQQQAARAVSEAAEDAERLTAAAERRLRELDEETDAVWRERERLLTDVREVSRTLATLADAAAERFPAAPELSAPQSAPAGPSAPQSAPVGESAPQSAPVAAE